MAEQSRKIQDYPLIRLRGEFEDNRLHGRLLGFQHGEGQVSIHAEDMTPPRLFLSTVLASLGQSNEGIGIIMGNTPNTVKSQLARASFLFGFRNRTHIGRLFLECGIYRLQAPDPSFDLSPAEIPVVDVLSHGKSNLEIARQLELSPLTVKSHLARITRKTGWAERESIALAGMLSKVISYESNRSLGQLQLPFPEVEMPLTEAIM